MPRSAPLQGAEWGLKKNHTKKKVIMLFSLCLDKSNQSEEKQKEKQKKLVASL